MCVCVRVSRERELECEQLSLEMSVGEMLRAAAREGDVRGMGLALDRGGAVAERGPGGWTALHQAALNGHVDCVEALLHNGAPIDFSLDDKSTALHLAARHDQRACVRALLMRPSRSLLMRDAVGWPAGHYLARNGDCDNLERLFNAMPAAVGELANDGSTAVHVAARARRSDALEVLFRYGADPNVADARGRTPAHAMLLHTVETPEFARAFYTLLMHGSDYDTAADPARYDHSGGKASPRMLHKQTPWFKELCARWQHEVIEDGVAPETLLC